jgi:preprotein translocase subunit SecE
MAGIQQGRASGGTFWGDFLSASLYKRNQGRVTRQVTFAALAVIIGLGVWRLAQLLPLWFGGGSIGDAGADLGVVRLLVPGLLLAAGLWFAFRMVNMPRFADFLISVEAEMAKVSWPTGSEVVRSSIVIIFLMFALAAILAGYDLFWRFVLQYVLRIV